jgi:hypothetical protein
MKEQPRYKIGDLFYEVTDLTIMVEEVVAVGIDRQENISYVYELVAAKRNINRDLQELRWFPIRWTKDFDIDNKIKNKEWFLSEEEAIEQFKKLSRRKI